MRTEIEKTDLEIELEFEDFGIVLDVEDLAFTRDTIADFVKASKGWRECRRVEIFESWCWLNHPEIAPGDIAEFEGVQVRKGDPRTDVIVFDFGAVRAVYGLGGNQ